MRRYRAAWLLCAAFLAGAVCADGGASFDCERAATIVERQICRSEELRWLDRLTDVAYQNLVTRFEAGSLCLRQDQQRWLRNVRNACGDEETCLRRVYRLRLAEWDALLPGALRLPNPPRHQHGLARVPALVAVIAPATDSDAAAGESLAVEGQLCEVEGAYAIATVCRYEDAGPQQLAGGFVAPALALVDGGGSVEIWQTFQRLAATTTPASQPHRYHVAGRRQTGNLVRQEPPRFSSAHCMLIHRTD